LGFKLWRASGNFNLEADEAGGYRLPRVKKLLEHFKALGSKLVTLRDTPHAIAGGVAIGVFVGFTPLFGIKTLLSLAGAYLLRCNPIAAVIAVSLHDVVTPLWPVLLRIEYDIGYWLLSHPHHLPPKLEMHHLHVSEMLKWTTFFHVGFPLLLGSLFLAAPSAALFYFLLLAFLQARQARHRGNSAGT
jgi:uncharacterized protein